jgi:hypothetical protein
MHLIMFILQSVGLACRHDREEAYAVFTWGESNMGALQAHKTPRLP